MSSQIFSQCNIIKKASMYYCKSDYQNTLFTLNKLKEKYPYFSENLSFIYSIGHLNYLLGNYDNSIIELEKLIKTNVIQDENYKPKFVCREIKSDSNLTCSNIISDGYDIEYLKEISCNELAEIYIKKEKYEDALKYLLLANSKYFTGTFCGNGDYGKKLTNSFLISEMFEKTNRPFDALKVLVPYTFSCLSLSENNTKAFEKCEKLISSSSKAIELKLEIDNAINNITFKTRKSGTLEYFAYFIKINNESFEIYYPYTEKWKGNKEYTIDDIKNLFFNDKFYQLLKNENRN